MTKKNITVNTIVECKCPKCEKIHKMRIHWSGNGMPRKYCEVCQPHFKTIGIRVHNSRQTAHNGKIMKSS